MIGTTHFILLACPQVLLPSKAWRGRVFGSELALRPEDWDQLDRPYFDAPGQTLGNAWGERGGSRQTTLACQQVSHEGARVRHSEGVGGRGMDREGRHHFFIPPLPHVCCPCRCLALPPGPKGHSVDTGCGTAAPRHGRLLLYRGREAVRLIEQAGCPRCASGAARCYVRGAAERARRLLCTASGRGAQILGCVCPSRGGYV